jgi:hypothetical protein
MTQVIFKAPPVRSRRTAADWSEIDRTLRAKSGEWARVAIRPTDKSASKLTSELRWGMSTGAGKPRIVLLELGAFEIKCDGREVYARFTRSAAA